MENNPAPTNPATPVIPPGEPAIKNMIPPTVAGNRPTPPPTEPEEKPFWKSKSMLVLVIILISILIPAVIFAASKLASKPAPSPSPIPTTTPSPTPIDETANWKTYADTQFGVKFKYPEAWVAKSNPKWEPKTIFLEDKDFVFCDPGCEFLTSIHINENALMNTETNQIYYEETTIEEKQKKIVEGFDPKTLKVSNLIVGGRKAVQISGTLGPGVLQGEFAKTTLIQMKDHLLMIGLSKEKYQGIYDQILSTFKFTDSSATESASASPSASPITQ